MNGGLSIVGLLGMAGALVAIVAGWRRGNAFLITIGAVILALAAWNTGVYVMGKRR